jgi:hypothetical protein
MNAVWRAALDVLVGELATGSPFALSSIAVLPPSARGDLGLAKPTPASPRRYLKVCATSHIGAAIARSSDNGGNAARRPSLARHRRRRRRLRRSEGAAHD